MGELVEPMTARMLRPESMNRRREIVEDLAYLGSLSPLLPDGIRDIDREDLELTMERLDIWGLFNLRAEDSIGSTFRNLEEAEAITSASVALDGVVPDDSELIDAMLRHPDWSRVASLCGEATRLLRGNDIYKRSHERSLWIIDVQLMKSLLYALWTLAYPHAWALFALDYLMVQKRLRWRASPDLAFRGLLCGILSSLGLIFWRSNALEQSVSVALLVLALFAFVRLARFAIPASFRQSHAVRGASLRLLYPLAYMACFVGGAYCAFSTFGTK